MAEYQWSHEIAHHLERDWWTIFNLNVKVGHTFTPVLGPNQDPEINWFLLSVNDSLYASIFLLQAPALNLNVNIKGLLILALKSQHVSHLTFADFPK